MFLMQVKKSLKQLSDWFFPISDWFFPILYYPNIGSAEFRSWAFGEDWATCLSEKVPTLDLVNRWNRLHGEQMYVCPSQLIALSLPKMQALYQENYANKHSNGS